MSVRPDPSKTSAHPEQATKCALPVISSAPPDPKSDRPVSPSDNPLSLTPKDVTPDDAAARDLVARHVDSADPDEKQQELLDDAIELSFHASDPPAVSGGITLIKKPSPAARP